MMLARHISVQVPPNKLLVDDVTIAIKPGVLTTVLGKNGAGKSSLLKAICGDLPTISGSVLLDDYPVEKSNIIELARKRAVVSQKITLEFSFTAREVVGMGRNPNSGYFGSLEDEEIIEECLAMVDASHLADRSITTLSGGEQQRVHFARAIAQIWDQIQAKAPSYLLLDEPLSSLDVAHQHEMMFVLKKLTTSNVAVFIILHDLNLAAQYSDLVHILKGGKLVASGTPFDVFTEDIIFDAFDHPVNVIPHPKNECPLIIARGF
jgi:iron complex transport system ATP-binding protein